MFKEYSTTELTDYDGWLTRVERILEHRHFQYIEWDTVINEIDLKSMYESKLTPRMAAEKAARIIYDLK